MDQLLIGQLATRLGINPKTIRYYERIKLLAPPQRSSTNYRLYTEADERRLRFILTARRTGFTLDQIKQTLALRDCGESPCGYVADGTQRRLRELDQRITELQRLRRELHELAHRAQFLASRPPAETGDGYCRILEKTI